MAFVAAINVTQARLDLDNNVLIKSLTLRKLSTDVNDSFFGTQTNTPTSYTIYGKVNPMSLSQKAYMESHQLQGDAIGVFRYEYSSQVDGTTISPAITIAEHDTLTFQSVRYEVTEIHPITNDTGDIICYEAKLTRTL